MCVCFVDFVFDFYCATYRPNALSIYIDVHWLVFLFFCLFKVRVVLLLLCVWFVLSEIFVDIV